MSYIFQKFSLNSLISIHFRLLGGAIFVLTCICAAQNISAATLTVTRADDRNAVCVSGVDCSLREAVSQASVGFQDDTINFASGLTTVTLTGEIEIVPAGALTIDGNGAVTIDGGAGTNRLFYINNTQATLKNVILQGGEGGGANSSGSGGAIFSSGGNLTLDSVVVRNNGDGLHLGGGVYLGGGTHRIINSTFSGNIANQCGGIYFSGSALSIANSTISGNIAVNGPSGDAKGAGLCTGGTAIIRNSTITNNSSTGAASKGGGIYNFDLTLNLGNTIVSGNTAADYPEILNQDTLVSAGSNLIGDSAGDSADTNNPIAYQASDILNIPPMLGPLTIANGGTTPTHALLINSPAVDHGNNALTVDPSNNTALAFDQRAAVRIFDGDGNSTAIVDIGAFELQSSFTAANVSISGQITANGKGLAGARVELIGTGGTTRSVMTNSLGNFTLMEVNAGSTYLVSVSAKKYNFAPQIVSANDNISGLTFTAQ